MTLATHILVAAAATKPFTGAPFPIVFAVALASHYLIDAVPHGDYSLGSIDDDANDPLRREVKKDPAAIARDLFKIFCDVLLGATLYYILQPIPFSLQALLPFGAVILGGILPDALQPVYYLWKRPPMTGIQQWHKFMHTNLRLVRMGYLKTAIVSQLAIVAIAAILIAF